MLSLLFLFHTSVAPVCCWLHPVSVARSRPFAGRFLDAVDDFADSNENLEDSELFYDDFGGQIIGGGHESHLNSFPREPSSPVTPTALQERIQSLQQTEIQKDAQLFRNWKIGNWQIRGFSLDPELATADPETEELARVHVCRIVAAADESGSVWVGRTDGSIVGVSLGSEYWTRFRSQLSAEASGEDIIAVSSKLVREEDDGSFMTTDDESKSPAPTTPFEILHQFKAGDSAVSAMVAVDQYLFTACDGSGMIQQWLLTADEQSDEDKVLATTTMTGAHEDTIVCLAPVSMSGNDEPIALFSAASDGSVALWDVASGDLLFKCQLMEEEGDGPLAITSATAAGPLIFLGTATGYILAFAVQDWMKNAAEAEAACPLPQGYWQAATDTPITALAFGGPGSLGRGRGQETTVLMTGCGDGTLKQWEILSRSTPGQPMRLEQWPKMATQRLAKKAHTFKGHEGSINSLVAVDGTKMVSSGNDGTVRAWNTATGKELFAMDGFTKCYSLCLVDEMLVTDGMEKFVCVHDFGVEEPDFDEEYFDVDGF